MEITSNTKFKAYTTVALLLLVFWNLQKNTFSPFKQAH